MVPGFACGVCEVVQKVFSPFRSVQEGIGKGWSAEDRATVELVVRKS